MPDLKQQNTRDETETSLDSNNNFLTKFRHSIDNDSRIVCDSKFGNVINEFNKKINQPTPEDNTVCTKEQFKIGEQLFDVSISKETKRDIHRQTFKIIFSDKDEPDYTFNHLDWYNFFPKLAKALIDRGYNQENITNLLNIFGLYGHQDGFFNMGQTQINISANDEHSKIIRWDTKSRLLSVDFTKFSDNCPLVYFTEQFNIIGIYSVGECPDLTKTSISGICTLTSELIGKNLESTELTIDVLEPEEIEKIILDFDYVNIYTDQQEFSNQSEQGKIELGYHFIYPKDDNYIGDNSQERMPATGIITTEQEQLETEKQDNELEHTKSGWWKNFIRNTNNFVREKSISLKNLIIYGFNKLLNILGCKSTTVSENTQLSNDLFQDSDQDSNLESSQENNTSNSISSSSSNALAHSQRAGKRRLAPSSPLTFLQPSNTPETYGTNLLEEELEQYPLKRFGFM